jgi:RimJ/RimL family protein N-acetyltransferase
MTSRPPLTIRPIRADDAAALAVAFERLSDESRYRRFLGSKDRLTARELAYLAEVDHVTHEALVAVGPDGAIVGVARYASWPGRTSVAEVAVTVADEWQGAGLGTDLTRRVVAAAQANGMATLTGSTFWANTPARRLLARLGFRPTQSSGGVVEFALDLAPAVPAAA